MLAHRYPNVPLHGDFTTIREGEYEPIELLVGGTPCQSFSIAGLRGGMADERGNLAFEYLRLAERLRPNWLLWENVLGVLSSNRGRDFGSFLGGMGQLGYGFAYRVLDAQYFGLAQRRQRVFVVGYLGDWRRAAAVLFEPASLRGHPAPRREAGKSVAGGAARGVALRGREGGGAIELGGETAFTLRASSGGGDKPHALTIARTLTANRAGGSSGQRYDAGTDTLLPVQPFTLAIRGRGDTHALEYRQDGTANALLTPNGGRGGIGVGAVACAAAVRRLTPVECCRLQGFPDDYLDIQFRGKPAADGNKYRALGNSMAVPCMAWIGQRIAAEHKDAA